MHAVHTVDGNWDLFLTFVIVCLAANLLISGEVSQQCIWGSICCPVGAGECCLSGESLGCTAMFGSSLHAVGAGGKTSKT